MSDHDMNTICAPNGAPLARVLSKSRDIVFNTAQNARIEDATIFPPCLSNPKFLLEKNPEGRFTVKLVARNGATVAELISHYRQKVSALNGIRSLQRIAARFAGRRKPKHDRRGT